MNKKNRSAFGASDALMLLAVVMWGINFSLIKIAMRELTAGGFNGLRLLLTAVIFLVLLAISGQGFRLQRNDGWKLLAIGVAGNTVYQLFFIRGISLTSASNSSLILSMSPIFVALMSSALGIERIHWSAWMGILISFCGLYWIVAGQNGGLHFSAESFKGDLSIFFGMILWASYTVFSKPFLERLSPLKFSAITVLFGALFYIPFTAKDILAVPWAAISLRAWAFLVLSSLFGFVFGYLIWYYSVKKVGNAKTAVYNNLTPVFTAVFAVALLGDRIHPAQIGGAAIILTGVFLARAGYQFFAKRP
ncbi:MAG: DMT family transporter [Candidatus Aminicenantales bacterium]